MFDATDVSVPEMSGVLVLAQSDVPAEGGGTTTSEPGAPGAGGTTGGGTAAPGGQAAPPPATNPLTLLIPMLLVIIVFMWISTSGQRKERKKREAMLEALRKHDRVQTIGGVIGSIVEVKDHEVVLKVDETNNVKMRFSKSAIQQVLSEPKDGSTTSAVAESSPASG